MTDHKDGQEAAAVGKCDAASSAFRVQHVGGARGERRKNEELVVNLANASGLAITPAPHPSATKKPHLPSSIVTAKNNCKR